MASLPRRLTRSRSERMVCGVAGGLAEYFDVDAVVVRLLFVITAFFSGVGLVAYILLCLLVPMEGEEDTPLHRVARRAAGHEEETAGEPASWTTETAGGMSDWATAESAEERARVRQRRQVGAGLILVALGLLFLLGNLGLFRWVEWRFLWPLVLILGGLALLLRRYGRR